MSATSSKPLMDICDWYGGDGQSMMPGYPCIQCGGSGEMRASAKLSTPVAESSEES